MNNRNTQLEKETVLAAEQLCHMPGRASFGISVSDQNEFAERIATEVFVYASVITAAAALTLF